MGWDSGGFSGVENAIFRFLRLFWGMMSLGRNTLFLGIWKGHSDPPPSQIDLKHVYFCDLKIRGGGDVDPPWTPNL